MLEKINEKNYNFSMNYCDAHTHLQNIENLHETMSQAYENGVSGFICNATHEDDWEKVISISKKYPHVFVALGVHPYFLSTLKSGWDKRLEKLLKDNPSFMVGEIGLDKIKADQDPLISSLDRQEQVMRIQMDLAAKYNRPFHLHCVRAWDRVLHILKRNKRPTYFVSHSHHGNVNMIPQLSALGAYFSYSSIFLPRNREKVRQCLKETPIDRLLVESDAPDLSKEVSVIPSLVEKMANLRQEEPTFLIEHIQKNFEELVNGRSI